MIHAKWRKSSYSGADSDNCVEVAHNIPALIAVRDSKALERHALTFGRVAWANFVADAASLGGEWSGSIK